MPPIITLSSLFFFFFNDTATTEIYTLSLHDALPIYPCTSWPAPPPRRAGRQRPQADADRTRRSEEHTSELQSPCNLVCRLLLEKKKKTMTQEQDLVAELVYPGRDTVHSRSVRLASAA